MSNAFVPAKTSASRVFLIEGRARGDHSPAYKSCMRAGPMEKGFGDISDIECPDSEVYGQFDKIGEIQETDERPTSNVMARYAADEESDLLRIGKKRCSLDVHYHFGSCTNAREFNVFTKAVIFENVRFTNYSTDDLGALGSDENAVVNETADLNAEEVYEVLPLGFAERGGDTVTVEVVDVVICDSPSCGDCDDESDGCETIFAVTVASAGSSGTAPDVVYSADKGATWAASDVNSLLPAEDANALACVGDYVVVVSNDSNSLHYATKTDVLGAVLNPWTEVTTGFVASSEPNDIWSVGSYAFIVGDGGYVYGCSDPTAGVSVLDAGVATTEDLYAVHAIDDEFAVAVGDSDTIIYTKNQSTWQDADAVTGSGEDLRAVWLISKKIWWVGTASGTLWYTMDGGQTWTQSTLPGASWDEITDIAFATQSVGYVAANKSTTRGYILRTFSGGGGTPPLGGWIVLPEYVGTMPLADDFNAIAACAHDPNFVVGVGLGDNGTDGIIVVGED